MKKCLISGQTLDNVSPVDIAVSYNETSRALLFLCQEVFFKKSVKVPVFSLYLILSFTVLVSYFLTTSIVSFPRLIVALGGNTIKLVSARGRG